MLLKARPLLLIAAIAAVSGLLLPTYAPLMSLAYVEMLPEHHHVVFSGTGAHAHEYQSPSAAADGVLAVPAPDDSGAFAIVVATGAALLLLRGSSPLAPRLQRLSAVQVPSFPSGLTVAPTAPPPRLRPVS